MSSSLPPVMDRGGWLVCSADEKASLFPAHFEAKQCRNSFQQPYSCGHCSMLRSVAFRSSLVCKLPLNPYGGNVSTFLQAGGLGART